MSDCMHKCTLCSWQAKEDGGGEVEKKRLIERFRKRETYNLDRESATDQRKEPKGSELNQPGFDLSTEMLSISSFCETNFKCPKFRLNATYYKLKAGIVVPRSKLYYPK